MKYFYLLLILYSCSQNNTKKVIFDKVRDVNIQRPEGHEDFFFSQVITIDSNEFLTAKLNQKNIIDVFDLSKNKTINSIEIPTKRSFKSFNYINSDSIYFKPQYSGTLFLFNKGEIDTIIDSDDPSFILKYIAGDNVGPIFDLLNSTVAPFVINNNNFYFCNMIDPNKDLSIQKPLIIYQNPHEELTIKTNIGLFPESMIKKNKSLYPFDMGLSFTLNNKNQIVCSYFADHKIYVYNQNDEIKVINCPSKYLDVLPQFIDKKETYDSKLIAKRQSENFSYVGIFYDRYREFYYRVVFHPNNTTSQTLVDRNDYDFSIMILNKKFDLIDEVIFNNKEYLGNQIHIVKEGILLKKPDDLSGYSRFSIFKPTISK